MFLIGFLSSAILTIGITFKLLHFPGATKLFMIGFLLLLLVFVPTFAFNKYRAATSSTLSDRLQIILGGASAVITGISGLFKFVHLQGADIFLILGVLIFVAGFLPLFFYSLYKKSIG